MTRTSMDLTKYANPRQEILEVQMLIWKQAKTMVQEMLGEPWTLFEYRSSPSRPSGSASTPGEGSSIPVQEPGRDPGCQAAGLRPVSTTQPLAIPNHQPDPEQPDRPGPRWLIRPPKSPHLHLLLMDSHCMRRIQNPIRTTVDAAIRDGIQEARIDGNPVRNAPSRTAARLERMVGSHLLDDETERSGRNSSARTTGT